MDNSGRDMQTPNYAPAFQGIYSGRSAALLTQHRKELIFAPLMNTLLGCRIQHVSGFDTDLLGTFTRDIPRVGTQLEAARRKARIGMELAGLPLGMASEGRFGPDPFMGMFPWNVELIVFIDDERGLEIVGMAEGKASFDHLLSGDWSEIKNFARTLEFPEQYLIMRPDNENHTLVIKGIASWAELESAFGWAIAQSASGQVFVETDGRAHANPLRQTTIRLATEDLVKKIVSLCPVCRTPGFWLMERIPGLPCEACGLPTRDTRAEIHGCLKCEHRQSRAAAPNFADPSHCDHCNP